MLFRDNGEGNRRTKNSQRQFRNDEELDLEGDLGGGGSGAGDPDPNPNPNPDPDPKPLDLITDVENEFVKGLNEEQIKTLIEENKATSFDKDGNLLDVDGNVLKSVEDYKDSVKVDNTEDPLKGVTSIDIEGTTYKVDENGNAINEAGEVVKTKDEIVALIAEEGDEGDEGTTIGSISSLTGFEAVDADGKSVEFEDTVEGIAARETHIVRQESVKLAANEINTFFDKNPDILDMVEYKRLHGTLKDYNTREDFSTVVLEENDDAQHRSMIIKAEMAKGGTEARAKQVAEFFIGDGKGKEEAENSLTYLKDNQKADDASIKADNDAAAVVEKEAAEKVMTEVAKVVKSGKVGDYSIPAYFKAKLPNGQVQTMPREAIFQLITQPLADGTTRYDKMLGATTTEQKVLDVYLRLTGYDTSTLVKQQASNDRIKNLKSGKTRINSKVTLHKEQSNINDEDLDLG